MTLDPNIGRLLANRYRLSELVGKGAMGRVYRAEDTLLGDVVVAVKFLAQTLLNSKMRDRFAEEAKTCAQLGQKTIHIVRVMDYGTSEDEVPFFVMEYLQGLSLSEVISARPILLPRFLSMTRQICVGLQCAHQGIPRNGQRYPIIHRDIKPSNILVTQDTSLGELVKILDFGIQKVQDSTQTNSFMGTLAYSSPEQMEGQRLDARSDIYSLGIMMYEMLSGKMPLQVESNSFGSWYRAHHQQVPRSLQHANPAVKIPKALETLVMSCLEKSPNYRPQSVGEVLRAIEPLEQRYSGGQKITERITKALIKTPSSFELEPHKSSVIDEISLKSIWPKNKPLAQIVFPQPLVTSRGGVATLWAMLNPDEIENFQAHKLYNQIYRNFLCTLSPHPMLMWVTALYNNLHSKEPRWLSAFLDLKTPIGLETIRQLSEQGQYYVVLFPKPAEGAAPPDEVIHAQHVMTVPEIAPQLRFQLQQWAIASQSSLSVGSPSQSRELLKAELEKLKPKIFADMQELANRSSLSLSKEISRGRSTLDSSSNSTRPSLGSHASVPQVSPLNDGDIEVLR